MRDLANRLVSVNTVDPKVITSDTNGTGVDLKGFESAMVVYSVGIEGDTLSGSVKFEIHLEHSDDNVTFTAVTASTDVTNGTVNSDGTFVTLDDNAESPSVHEIGYLGGKRYIRVVVDATGSHSNGTPMAAVVIKGDPLDSQDSD